MGTPAFALPSLEGLVQSGYQVVGVVTQPDREAGRGYRLVPPPVKTLALRYGLSVLQPPRVSRPAVVAQLQELRPSLIVVAAFGQLLPPAILAIPPFGCLNVHASLLPRHRGASPISAAILAGDTETGVTIMRMDEGMDTGDILAQARAEIGPEETAAVLGERLARLGASLLLDTIPRWVRGEITPQPQDHSQATYCRPLHKEDGHINWQESAEYIHRQVRAYDPWPGAYTYWQNKILKIRSARPLPDWSGAGEPGRVVQVDSQALVVAGRGALLLREVQLAGKRAMAIEEFLRGQRDFIGSLLT